MSASFRIIAEFVSPANEERPFAIFGRVVEDLGKGGSPTWYRGQLSHWCKQSEFAHDIYRSPDISHQSVEDAVSHVRIYLEGFNPRHGFELNPDCVPR